jgi:hypothetical protein
MSAGPGAVGGGTRGTRRAILWATLGAGFMMAQQIAAKATRDAYFLSQFDITNLPAVWIAGALLSLFVVFAASRALSTHGPARLTPALFVASGILLCVEGLVGWRAPRIGAVAVYLHVAVFGALAISGFWSVLSEQFDPRTAKRSIARIAAGGTIGGLIGGAIANRIAPHVPLAAMLPLLGGFHLVCAVLTRAIAGSRPFGRDSLLAGGAWGGGSASPADSGLTVLRRTPYLRQLAILVLITTAGAGLLDYVFKSFAAASRPDGAELLGFFSLFYTSVGIATFLAQTLVNRRLSSASASRASRLCFPRPSSWARARSSRRRVFSPHRSRAGARSSCAGRSSSRATSSSTRRSPQDRSARPSRSSTWGSTDSATRSAASPSRRRSGSFPL